MKSTPRVSSTVSISYINRMESCETVPKSYIHTRINTRMSHDHLTIHTSVHTFLYDHHTTNTVSYDRHTTNTVQVRIIPGQVRPDTVSTSVQSSCIIIQHSNTTENTTTCCHIEAIEYLLHKSIILTKHDPSVKPFSCANLPPSSSISVGLFLSPLAPSG